MNAIGFLKQLELERIVQNRMLVWKTLVSRLCHEMERTVMFNLERGIGCRSRKNIKVECMDSFSDSLIGQSQKIQNLVVPCVH